MPKQALDLTIHRILLCMLCISVFFLPRFVFANESAHLTIGQATAEPGERVTIPFSLESNPGLAYIRLTIEYDATRLRVDSPSSITPGNALNRLSFVNVNAETYRQNPFKVLRFGTLNDSSTGVLINIDFTVLDVADAGNAFVLVTIADRDAYNRDGVIIPVSITQGSVTVLGDEVTQPTQPELSPAIPAPTPQPPTTDLTPPHQLSPAPDDQVSLPPEAPSSPPAETQPAPIITPTPVVRYPYIPIDIPVVTPQFVNVEELPEYIQALINDEPVFIVESTPDEEQFRVLMSIPHATTDNTLTESIVSYRINLDGTLELVIPSMYDEESSVIWLLGYTNELYMVKTNFVEFMDVAVDKWYYNAITFMAAREVFSGVGNNQFAPQTTMTRAMFITALSRIDSINPSLFVTSPFTDVDIESWYGSAIAWAMMIGIIDYGILFGNEPGIFRPHDSITREEMAVIFSNYLGIHDFPLVTLDVPIFDDLYQASHWARDAVQTMRSHSIISGVGNNRYNPQSEATRAEVAQIFTNLVRAIVGLS